MSPLRASAGILRTSRGGQTYYRARDWIKAALAFSLCPALVGFAMVLLVSAGAITDASAFHDRVGSIGGQLLFAPFVTIWAAPVVLGILAALMAIGWAGWAFVLALTGGLVGGAAWIFVGDTAVSLAIGAILHVGSAWWCLDHLEPDALCRPR